MNAKFGFIFLGSIFILEAIWALSGGKIYFKYQGWQTISEKSIFGFFIVGLFFICLGIFYKSKRQFNNKNFNFISPKTKKQPKKPKGEKVKFDKPKNKFSLKNIKFKNNKPLNLLLATLLFLFQTTLQASLLPNSQILQSNLNSFSLYTKPYINLYEPAFSEVPNLSDYLQNGIAHSPYQGIIGKIENAGNYALNNKMDTAKAVKNEIKNSLSDCANSPLNCGSNILQGIGNGIIDGTYGLAYNILMPDQANNLNDFYGFNASDYLVALSAANLANSGLTATGIAGVGKVTKDGVVAVGRAGMNGATKFATQIETNALTKITENLPKNAVYNPTNGIIAIENKNFIQVGTDTLTNSPILREIGYNQGNYVLKGNHYVSTTDGLYVVGKNALQNTGTKVITNSSLKDIMTPSINPISDMYYRAGNFIIDPRTWIYETAGVEALDGYYGGNSPDYKNIGSWIMGIKNFSDYMENK